MIGSLTGLRFFAALLVVLLHYQAVIGVHYPYFFDRIASDGRVGVSLFFVLSGFILTYNYCDWFCADLSRSGAFFRARFARIVPMHVVTLLGITPLIVFAWTVPVSYFGTSRPLWDFPATTVFLSWLANLFMVHAFFPFEVVHIWNTPSWSISNEAFFYLLFPVFVRHVLRRISSNRSLLLLAVAFYAVEFVAFAVAVVELMQLPFVHVDTDVKLEKAAMWSPFLRVWEFFIGCIAGVYYVRQGPRPLTGLGCFLKSRLVREAAILVTLGVLAGVEFLTPTEGVWGWYFQRFKGYVLFTPEFVVLITVLAFGPTFLSRLLELDWIVRLGDASYSLYLIHWIPIAVMIEYRYRGNQLPPWLPVATILLSVAASLLTQRFIEAPARLWLRSKGIKEWANAARSLLTSPRCLTDDHLDRRGDRQGEDGAPDA